MLTNSLQYLEPFGALSSGHSMLPKESTCKTSLGSSASTKRITRRASAYDPGFEQHLINYGIYPDGYEYPDDLTSVKPDNWEEIQRRLIQPRPSLSPSNFSDRAFSGFRMKHIRALNETEVMINMFPIINGDSNTPSALNRTFGT